jgi:hypothetical protein
MQLHGNRSARRNHRRKKGAAPLGGQQARRILDRNEVDGERNELACPLDVVIVGVHGRQRVGHHGIYLHAGVVPGAHRRDDVPVVVERVVHGENLDSAPCERVRVERDDIVGKELECI